MHYPMLINIVQQQVLPRSFVLKNLQCVDEQPVCLQFHVLERLAEVRR